MCGHIEKSVDPVHLFYYLLLVAVVDDLGHIY